MDGLPDDEKKIKKHYKHALNLCKMNVASVVKNGYGSSRAVILVKDIFVKPAAKLIGRKRIAKYQRKLGLKYSYSHAPKCGMVTWAYDGPGQAMPREKFEKMIEMPFEGRMFSVTSLWDENLTGIFGDYMTLPPEEERITHDLEAYR